MIRRCRARRSCRTSTHFNGHTLKYHEYHVWGNQNVTEILQTKLATLSFGASPVGAVNSGLGLRRRVWSGHASRLAGTATPSPFRKVGMLAKRSRALFTTCMSSTSSTPSPPPTPSADAAKGSTFSSSKPSAGIALWRRGRRTCASLRHSSTTPRKKEIANASCNCLPIHYVS